MKIYVSAPYSADSSERILENVKQAIDAGIKLWKKGHYPYIPHLSHWVAERAREIGVEMKYVEFLEWDRVWLEECDAVLYLGGSRGADFERSYAKMLGKRIFFDVDDVPEADWLKHCRRFQDVCLSCPFRGCCRTRMLEDLESKVGEER